MPDMSELESLVTIWRDYVAKHPAQHGPLDPDDRYLAGLTICADQLDETLKRMRADA